MWMWSHAFENSAIITKPRIDDAGAYSLSNRFEKGCVRCWLPGVQLKAGPTKWLIPISSGLYQLS